MNRRNLFKAIGGLFAAAMAAPLAKLMPENKITHAREEANVVRSAFEEVDALEKRVNALVGHRCHAFDPQLSNGVYSYTVAYLDKQGNILQPNIHVYRTET